MQQTLILSFTDDSITLDQAGGKGMNLARTACGGFPVPPGFILTTAAYQTFVQTNRIDVLITDRHHSLEADNPVSLDEVSGSIC